MAIDANFNPAFFHRKWGKLFYDISPDIVFAEDLIIDDNGAPDVAQNPNGIYIGATDAGYEFNGEPTIVDEEIDEADTPIEEAVESIAATITFDSLEVTDLERQAALLPHASFSTNTVGAVTHERITAGGSRIILPTRPVAVISPEKTGGWLYVILWSAFNSSAHQLQFKRKERSKQNMVIKGIQVAGRDEGDRIYRVGKQLSVLLITSISPVTPAGANGVTYPGKTFLASGGTAPYTWTVLSGALPTGLVLSSAGVLSGTPSAAGAFTYTLRAMDFYGRSITKAFAQTVTA